MSLLYRRCYYCKRKESETQFPVKRVDEPDEKEIPVKFAGKIICFSCCEELGFFTCVGLDEFFDALNEDRKLSPYKNFKELLKIVQPRKAAYDKTAAAFKSSRFFSEDVEVDEKNHIIRLPICRIMVSGRYHNYIAYSQITHFQLLSRKNTGIVYFTFFDEQAHSFCTFTPISPALRKFFAGLVGETDVL